MNMWTYYHWFTRLPISNNNQQLDKTLHNRPVRLNVVRHIDSIQLSDVLCMRRHGKPSFCAVSLELKYVSVLPLVKCLPLDHFTKMATFLAFFLFCVVKLCAANTVDSSSTSHVDSITFVEHAIEPSCSTTLIPISSTCHVGVHTLASTSSLGKRAAGESSPGVSFVNKAIKPSCITSYSTSTTCHAGVHPQPTFSETEIVVTETTSPTGGGTLQTITTTTMAELSVSVPPATATATANYMFYITPKLQEDIVEIANSFCPGVKEKRQSGGAASCRLPQSLRAKFLAKFSKKVGLAVEIDKTVALTAAAAVFVLGTWAFERVATGKIVKSDIPIEPQYVQSALSAQTTSTTTSTSKDATLFPGPPNNVLVTPMAQDVIALTSHWESYFESVWPTSKTTITVKPTITRLPCSHGADPGIHPGTAGYCQCTDGKIYPISPKTETTTIDGTKTTYLNDCPYTTIPKSTADRGTTIKPTIATTTQPLALGSATCFHGAFFKYNDMTNRVSSFCKTASRDGYKFTHAPGATATPGDNLFQSQFFLTSNIVYVSENR